MTMFDIPLAGDGRNARSPEEIAEVCVQSLLVPQARGKTFEIYNEPGQAPQEWPEIFGKLKSDAHL